MKEIKKKIQPKYFKEVAEGKKDFEIRKDDSDYEVGDILILQEYINYSDSAYYNRETPNRYTGNEITKRIKYKITHEEFPQGIQEGYCILGLEDIEIFKRYQHFNKILNQEKSAEIQALEMILSGINEKLSLDYLSDEDFVNYSNKFETQIKWLNEGVEK